ncbi:hypothetical protein VTN77DRAFT_817 [Rasamsonia byssochlamydoides]|uniref:uncharacterized protein n=1 Tax=Rasamsonia byssochlamydoides TaxID=89139 RepID=UPI0037436CCE
MSKRPHGESASQQHGSSPAKAASVEAVSSSSNGLPPINELLTPSEPEQQEVHVKKPRNFIATVACENCRLKKTRCDESRPKCGLCKTQGLECVYSERKLSKKDQSLSMIISTLHRIETKLENLPSAISSDMQPVTGHILQAVEALRYSDRAPSMRTSPHGFSQTSTPSVIGQNDLEIRDHRDPIDAKGQMSISFSQHGVVLWPGARTILPERLLAAHERLGKNYVIDLEMNRPPLPMWVHPFPLHAGDNWLETLPFSIVKGLSEAFFSTFNPFTPILDKHFFFAFTLGTVIKDGFGFTIETCLVLNVMALGCLAVRAYQEGDFPLPGTLGDRFELPAWLDVIEEEPPGLRFFNEARRRIGFLMCGNDLQSCQYYLLSAVYYTQIIRPMDSWAMLNRAAACCLSMLTNREINFDEWEGDMKSRVFWNTVMYETILVQELDLPSSGLARLEDYVPIPKFIAFNPVGLPASMASVDNPDDQFFQYHFLAQVAHRIILTRIRHSLYVFSESGTLPRPAVNAELHHQIEQWRLNLPPAIQFSSEHLNNKAPPSDGTDPTSTTIEPGHAVSPAVAVADAMLRGRFRIAKFHIGRPYLYKALRIPGSLTEDDFEQIRSGLKYAMDWPIVRGIFRRMKSCIPIKFAFCSQFFGQILLFYCISHSPDRRLRETLPPGWERWYEEMIQFLEGCAPYSPAIAQDLELLRLL